MKAWEAGESVASEKVVTPPPAPDTPAVVIPLADGMLWKGDSTEKTNFAHLWAIADILSRGTSLDDIDTHALDTFIKGLATLGKDDGTRKDRKTDGEGKRDAVREDIGGRGTL